MNAPDTDPFAQDPRRWVGRQVKFDAPGHESPTCSKRHPGTVISQKWAGRTKRGAIPDYTLEIEGASGRRIFVSMVEAHCTFPPSP